VSTDRAHTRRSTHRVPGAIAVVAALALSILAAPAGAAPVRVETACFTVRNTGDPVASTLYGRRFTSGRPAASTPAIVLVHGIASTTANWDFTPSWSVARRLASAGFVVIAYDRLGFGRSTYDRPKGGHLITTPNQRDMLHELVGAVKAGGYDLAAGADCSTARTPSTLRSPTVVIAGHSAGGAIVQGYPGAYHDVAAMVQADYSNSGSGDVVARQIADVVAPALARGEDYVPFFQTRQQCEDFNVHWPGAVRSVVQIACDPAGFVLTPAGEFSGFPALQEENKRLIPATGRTPVLLTYADHDAAFPPALAQADHDYWVTHCAGCDIARRDQTVSGHLFQVHRAMAAWVDGVVGWLASRGISP
jgi:pimeloyl-ACP methyl ester carboxylesterase